MSVAQKSVALCPAGLPQVNWQLLSVPQHLYDVLELPRSGWLQLSLICTCLLWQANYDTLSLIVCLRASSSFGSFYSRIVD